MIDSFKRFIAKHSLFTSADKLLLAVSGGVDSMVMADLMLKSGFHFSVAHCNFKLRDTQSDLDESLVKKWCEENKIDFYSTSFQTKTYALENQISIQMAARDLRYHFFNELCNKHQLRYIATAHHADDFAETVFIKILRQSGSAALQGILPKDGNRIRPLLFATKNEIIEYAKQNHLRWREDESNLSDTYQRNKIRLHVLPLLNEINPSLSENLVEQADFIYGEGKIIRHYIADVSKQIVSRKDDDLILSIKALKNVLSPLTVLHYLIEPFGFRMSQTVLLFDMLDITETKKFYSTNYILTKNRNEIVISLKTTNEPVYFEIAGCGTYEYDGKIISVSYEEKSFEELLTEFVNNNPYQAWFDADVVTFPIIIRSKKEGDRFQPLGMKNNKKLSDFFIDLKYTADEKEKQWLMESNKEIFWIVGKRISENARTDEKSKSVLKITVGNV